jgi:hypothetical protein
MTKFMFRLSRNQYLTQANDSIITKQNSNGPERKPQDVFFPLGPKAPAQRSARRSATDEPHAACRGSWTVGEGS